MEGWGTGWMGAYIGVRGERVVQVDVLMILGAWVLYKGGGWPAGTWAEWTLLAFESRPASGARILWW